MEKKMRLFILCFMMFGCSEYNLNEKFEDIPPADTAEEPPEDIENPPIAVSSSSVQVKREAFVQLDGTASYDVDNEQEILQYSWELTSFPEGSAAFLDDPTSGQPYLYADILGTYVIELEVTDSTGLVSTYSSATMVEVIPYEDMMIDVTWDIDGTDMDLHLVAPTGGYYGDLDCFYGNPNPDWGILNDRSDNPSLSFDDEGSERREAIDYLRPYDGFYDVYVLYYRNLSSDYPYVTPHVTIWGEGEVLVDVDGPRLTGEGSVWYVGRLDWSMLSFEMSADIYNHTDLGGLEYD
jgi:hypothetical protein